MAIVEISKHEQRRDEATHAGARIQVVLVVGVDNIRSRMAVERIGGVLMDRRIRSDVHGRGVELVVYEIKKPSSL